MECFFDTETKRFVNETYTKTDTGLELNVVTVESVTEAAMPMFSRSDIYSIQGLFWDTKKEGRPEFEHCFGVLYSDIFDKVFKKTDFGKTMECFLSNRRMMMLNDKEIPTDIITGLKACKVTPSKMLPYKPSDQL